MFGMDSKKIMVLFILFIMIFSVIGVVLNYSVPQSAPLEYEGFEFRLLQNQFEVSVGGKDRLFFFFPVDVEYVNVSDDVRSLLAKPVWTVSYDPFDERNSTLAEAQYYLESQLSDVRTIERSLTSSDGSSLPQRSCDDATVSQPFLLLSFGNETGISSSGDCVTLSAVDDVDLLRLVERVSYHVFGVMK